MHMLLVIVKRHHRQPLCTNLAFTAYAMCVVCFCPNLSNALTAAVADSVPVAKPMSVR
jgi:hypothetical protein